MSMVDISGLDKADVLAALYNKAHPIGLGVLNARSEDMTREQAQQFIEEGASATGDYTSGFSDKNPLYFDYVIGRPLKIDLSKDELDPWGYDRDHGASAMQQVINGLRHDVANRRQRLSGELGKTALK